LNNVRDGRYEQRVRLVRSIIDYTTAPACNTLYHCDAQRDYRNLENNRYNADNSLVRRRSAYLRRHEQRVDGNRFELRHNDTLFSMNSQWSAGFDYSVNQQKLYAKGRLRRMRS
jgi:iron complex outermembrane receptor protein